VRDPSNNQQTLTQTFVGGNADLQPEKADTFTAGLVFSPKWSVLEGLRVSVDYYDIDLKDAISTLGAQVIVTRCAQGNAEICSLLTRNSAGIVQQIFNRNRNLNEVKTKGVDIEASYGLPLSRLSEGWDGRLTFTALATYVKDLVTIDSAGVAVDRAGQVGGPTSQPSGVPSWSTQFQATYDKGPFAMTVQARYIAGGHYDNTLVGPDASNFSPFLTNSINDNTIPAFVYWNLNTHYNIVDRDDRQIQVYGAVSNLFDKSPPISPSSYGQVNSVLYDVVGRSFRIGVRLRR
jgi:outer membrane receptor protein involved in Fe transport